MPCFHSEPPIVTVVSQSRLQKIMRMGPICGEATNKPHPEMNARDEKEADLCVLPAYQKMMKHRLQRTTDTMKNRMQ